MRYEDHDAWEWPRNKSGKVNHYLIAYNHKSLTNDFRSSYSDSEYYRGELVEILDKYSLFDIKYSKRNRPLYVATDKLHDIFGKYIFNSWSDSCAIVANGHHGAVSERVGFGKYGEKGVVSFYIKDDEIEKYLTSYYINPFGSRTEDEARKLAKSEATRLTAKFNKFLVIATDKDDEDMYYLPEILIGDEFLAIPFIEDDIEILMTRIK